MTSKMVIHDGEIITCNVCSAECKSWAYYPGCNPFNPSKPNLDQSYQNNCDSNDFFGQFIPSKNIRFLSALEITRFHEMRNLLCPACYDHKLPLNPTSDGYLICSFCNIHWDVFGVDRPAAPPEYKTKTVSRLRPDGSIYRRKLSLPVQNANSLIHNASFDIQDIPF